MNNILTDISLEKAVQSSLQLDAEKRGRPKLTIESVKQHIESFTGYRLLSTEYVGSGGKLFILCPKEHLYKVKYNSFQNGVRCAECASNAKHRLSNVKRHIESFGYKLISTRYVNARAKLDIICNKGHHYKTAYENFQQGKRCSECYHLSQRRTLQNGEEWEPKIRCSRADLAWVIAVKKRDGQICQACFLPAKEINAHHIESYARNPELQTEITNGITLCKSCHTDLHSRYGLVTATRSDLEEFTRLKCDNGDERSPCLPCQSH